MSKIEFLKRQSLCKNSGIPGRDAGYQERFNDKILDRKTVIKLNCKISIIQVWKKSEIQESILM